MVDYTRMNSIFQKVSLPEYKLIIFNPEPMPTQKEILIIALLGTNFHNISQRDVTMLHIPYFDSCDFLCFMKFMHEIERQLLISVWCHITFQLVTYENITVGAYSV